MSKIFGFSFCKQKGTTMISNRRVCQEVVSIGRPGRLPPGHNMGGVQSKMTSSTNQETEYTMWLDPSWQTIKIDGVDATATTPMGMAYPLLLTAGSIEPQNLMTIEVSDPYPWTIVVYADSTKVVFGDQTSSGTYDYLWPPDVQGGTP